MTQSSEMEYWEPLAEPSPGFWATLEGQVSELAVSHDLHIGFCVEGPRADFSLQDALATVPRGLWYLLRTGGFRLFVGWDGTYRVERGVIVGGLPHPRTLTVPPTGKQHYSSWEEARAECVRILKSRKRNFRRCYYCRERFAPEDYTRVIIAPLDAYTAWQQLPEDIREDLFPEFPIEGPRKAVCWSCLSARQPAGGVLIRGQRLQLTHIRLVASAPTGTGDISRLCPRERL
jgi:hypothetical protein